MTHPYERTVSHISLRRSTIHAYEANPIEVVCRFMECGGVETGSYASVVTGVVLLGLGLVVVLTYIPEARSELKEEHERVATERDAIAAFQRKVSGIEAVRSAPTGRGAVAIGSELEDSGFERIKDAYRETVMSVPHYEEEYDEPIEANMTAELGDEMAAAVFGGRRYTQPIKRGLVSQCNEARHSREELLTVLEREQRRLTSADEELCDIVSELETEMPDLEEEHTFSELSDRWTRLGDVESRCREFLEEHSESRGNAPHNRSGFQEYVYQSLPTEHPVLSDGTRVFDRITECRQTVLRALTRTV